MGILKTFLFPSRKSGKIAIFVLNAEELLLQSVKVSFHCFVCLRSEIIRVFQTFTFTNSVKIGNWQRHFKKTLYVQMGEGKTSGFYSKCTRVGYKKRESVESLASSRIILKLFKTCKLLLLLRATATRKLYRDFENVLIRLLEQRKNLRFFKANCSLDQNRKLQTFAQ